METVQRFDLAGGSVGARRRTPQGGLIADAKLTRTGVLSYMQPDGRVQRELRHPREVFAPESLATLAHAPVTMDHPAAVTPDNWRDVAVGHVASEPKPVGKFVGAEIRLHDSGAIDKAEKGSLQELSCGYQCHLDRTPGEYEGEKYDAIQKDIRYNHVAAGPSGWGRAGPEVRMRLDGGCGVSGADSYVPGMGATEQETKLQADLKTANDALTRARADEVAAKAHSDSLTEEAKKAQAKIAQDAAEKATLKAENELLKLQVKRHTEDSTSQEAKKKFDSAIEETISVRAAGARIFEGKSDWKHDGKTNVAIKREVLGELEPDMKLDGLSDEAIDACFRLALTHADAASSARGELQDVAIPHRDSKRGSEDEEKDDVKKAYDEMCARNKDAWKKGKRDNRAHAAEGSK